MQIECSPVECLSKNGERGKKGNRSSYYRIIVKINKRIYLSRLDLL